MTQLMHLSKRTEEYARTVVKIGTLMKEAIAGSRRAQIALQMEAFTSSDFTTAFQDLTNAQILQSYNRLDPGLWTTISEKVVKTSLKRTKFKSLSADATNLPAEVGGVPTTPGGLALVPELQPYPMIGFVESDVEFGISKFGGMIAFSWEGFQVDDYDVIRSLPDKLSELALRTADLRTFARILGGTEGWNATAFGASSGGGYWWLRTTDGAATNNPVLTLQSLQAALGKATSIDPTVNVGPSGEIGYRINSIQKWALVCSPSLEFAAKAIISATEIVVTDANGTKYNTPNLVGSRVVVVPCPYIYNLASTASTTVKAQMWGLFPLNGRGADRPSLITTFLAGHESPELRIKDNGSTTFGSDDSFSFENDEAATRVRMFTDAVLNDKVGIVLSSGAGS